MRIALMLESDGPGGAEMMMLRLAEGLRARGHEITPVGPDNGSGWLADRFRDAGFEPRTFSLRRPVDFACLRGLETLLRAQQVEVVHSHEFTMAVYGAAAASHLGRRHVITMHGGRYYAEQLRRRIALRWALRRSAALVAVSTATARDLERLLGIPAAAITVVPNGIPFADGARAATRNALGIADDESLLIAIGNLYPVKGHAVLLRALAALDPAIPWRLAIAGRGEEEPALRALASDLGIDSRVQLLGLRSDVPDVLAAADVYVMPSLSEGLPLALVEAMGAGLPIVVSRVGGIPEVVTEGRDALLVPPGEAEPLARALERMLADAPLRRALGAAARERARREYSLERMVDAYERLYAGGDIAAPRLRHLRTEVAR